MPRAAAVPAHPKIVPSASEGVWSTNEDLARATFGVEVDDSGWPNVVLRRGPQAEAGKPLRLLFGLDRAVARGGRFGLVFDLVSAARAGVLVGTALAQRAAPMAARCVGAATVVQTSARSERCLAEHPVLFPFPSVPVASREEGEAWVRSRSPAPESFVLVGPPTGGM